MKGGKSKKRTLVLYSGGLDSILAAKILEKQGIDVTALTFVSYFFDAVQAEKSAAENNIKFIAKDFSKPHFEIVKNPKFGRGAGMNPCIDCHLLMLKVAKKIATQEGCDIIATGEVMGQRPMSQNAKALKLIEKEAGLVGKILRPLSAKVLPETEYEKKGWVSREKLCGFSGRSRGGQMELAKECKVKNHPSPAGGCILTDKEYSKKLSELFEKVKNPGPADIGVLRLGRHFWAGGVKIVLGRNHEENLALKKIAEKDDTIVEPRGVPGPTALIRGKNKKAIELAENNIKKYAKKIGNKHLEFVVLDV